MIKTTRIGTALRACAAFMCARAIGGCGDLPGPPGSAPVEESTEALSGGSPVPLKGFSVEVDGCSAVAINQRAILTAGHCMWDAQTAPKTPPVITTNIRATTSTGTGAWVFKGNAVWFRKTNYNRDDTGTDIALVVLPLPMSNVVFPTTMWNGAISVGQPVTVYGWGDPNDDHRYTRFSGLDQVTAAGIGLKMDPGVGLICGGDSGGPWVNPSSQILGLTSHAYLDAKTDCTPVGQYASAHRLSASMDWIRGHFLYACQQVGEAFYVANGTGNQYIDCTADNTMFMGPLVNVASGLCVDAKWDSEAAQTPVQIYPCNTTEAQQWYYAQDEQAIRFRDGMCVDVQWGNLVDGNPVWLWPCTGNYAQKWVRQYGPGGPTATYTLQNTNFCLTASSTAAETQLTIATCNGSAAQRFTFQ
jgi:V8-like Glu-specific endopeptidase